MISPLRTARRPLFRLIRNSNAAYHASQTHYRSVAQSKQDSFSKVTQGFNVLRNTLLNGPVLKHVSKPAIDILPFTGKARTWEDAVLEAQSLVASESQERIIDPVKLVGPDLWELKGNITKLLGSNHPFLNTMMTHYMCDEGKHIRPLLVLLMAKATSHDILDTQRRLADITQMIHTSSLLHYDVMDEVNFGNKMAILAGDFLLARASLALAYLRNAECVELMATCIANLVEGEFMHLDQKTSTLDEYMQQIYMKTASLVGQSCKGSAVLSRSSDAVSKLAYDYGRHFGLAYQLLDDVHQFTTKPLANLRLAPVLLAGEHVPELRQIIERDFKESGDADKAVTLVYQGNGVKKTVELAESHCSKAIDAVSKLESSDAQQALIQLANMLSQKNTF